MIHAAVRFARAWATRFFEVQGIDRAMALAAQGFSAMFPLLIVYSAYAPAPGSRDFADSLIDRFDLTGAAATSVRQAFSSSETVEDSATVVGVLLLIVSALAFTRGLQRLYEGAYKLPTLGMRNTIWDLVWLAGIVLYGSARPVIAGLFDRPVLQLVISLALATAAWTATPYLLLGRRLPYRALLAGALLAALGMSALAASSVFWLPRTIASSADQFGVMGVAFALLSWLVGASVVLVVAATGGAVTAERLRNGRRVTPGG